MLCRLLHSNVNTAGVDFLGHGTPTDNDFRPRTNESTGSIAMHRSFAALIGLILFLHAASARAAEFSANFDNVQDRAWIGPAFWANPMEDFRVSDGRIEVTRGGPNRNIAVLTVEITQPAAPFELSVKVGRVAAGEGSAGFRLGVSDEIDDYRAAALRGRGLDVGVTTSGIAFIGAAPAIKVKRQPLPEAITLKVNGKPDGANVTLTVTATDAKTGDEIDSVAKVCQSGATCGPGHADQQRARVGRAAQPGGRHRDRRASLVRRPVHQRRQRPAAPGPGLGTDLVGDAYGPQHQQW